MQYLNGGKWKMAAEYVETEEQQAFRPAQVGWGALTAKAVVAKLVFVKLDRLTREVVHFGRAI
jgi:hypothetical protein